MTNTEEMYSEIIKELLTKNYIGATKVNKLKINFAKKYGYKGIIKNAQIIAYSSDDVRVDIVKILNVKPIRELSGVTVVALFAKPHSCPHGKCIYCPGGPDSPFGDTPQSYTGKEPAAQRAIRNNYDPYLQIFNRLEHYCINGHLPDKLELIFMGGTFPSLDREYKVDFVNFVYKAINDFGDEFLYLNSKNQKIINYKKFNEFFEVKRDDLQSIERQERIHKKILELKANNVKDFKFEIHRSETAIIRSIGLTIETKPDWAMEEHCSEMLEFGCTRFEVGVQTLNDECLKKTNRGHNLDDTKRSFQVMKDMCFKINAHMMIGLPMSNLKIDKESLIGLFEQPAFRPDMLKIYPCLVVQGTPLFKLWEAGLFKAVETAEAANIISDTMAKVPRYVRVMRVQRDIPTPQISGGVQNSNLRQYVDKAMVEKGIISNDIRAREIGFRQLEGRKLGNFDLKVEEYESSNGKDIFIDVADEEDTMIGFIRLRLPSEYGFRSEIVEGTALIRELHIYGQTIPVGAEQGKDSEVQHKGWGRKLLEKAENIAKEKGFKKMVIISGVGVREYYKKFGYTLEGPYMVKSLK